MNDDTFGHDQSPDNADLTECFAALASLPGCDPVWLAAEDQRKMIPSEGWFINAKVAPGAMCIVDVYRYSGGDLRFDNIMDSSGRDGRICAQFSLKNYENLTLAYRSYEFESIPDLSTAGVLLPSTISARDLQSGRLLSESQRDSDRELVCEEVVSLDISKYFEQEAAGQYDPHSQEPVPVCRVTDHQHELLTILRRIGFAVGMNESDTDVFLTAASQKLGF